MLLLTQKTMKKLFWIKINAVFVVFISKINSENIWSFEVEGNVWLACGTHFYTVDS